MRPFSPTFDEHYWSPAGGVVEKTAIFWEGNHLSTRLPTHTGLMPFCIAELGFGTGLNAAIAAHLAGALPLTFISFESHPLPLAELEAIHASLPPHLQLFLTPLRTLWPTLVKGWTTCSLSPNTTLHLWIGDATEGILSQPFKANAWYLDGFSPAKNPALWGLPLMQQVAFQSHTGATAATYSIARVVRDNLSAAGFRVEKLKGVPPKRDRLEAWLTG